VLVDYSCLRCGAKDLKFTAVVKWNFDIQGFQLVDDDPLVTFCVECDDFVTLDRTHIQGEA